MPSGRQICIFGSKNNLSLISQKKIEEDSKYWGRNGGFTFSPEVKV